MAVSSEYINACFNSSRVRFITAVLVMKARMHAFVALMVVSIGAGLFSGMPLDKIAATMEKGMGEHARFLAIVVALGAMFGKILHETGAVDQIAVKMLKSFGHSRAHYAIGPPV